MEFVVEFEDQAALALMAGQDRTLAEKCSAEEYDLRQVIATAVTRESSRSNGEVVKVQEAWAVEQIKKGEKGLMEKVDRLQWDMQTIMKIQKRGKYSGQAKKTGSKCTFEQDKEGSCPANGRECRRCGQEGQDRISSVY